MDLKKVIKDKNLKYTQAREELLNVLYSSTKPVSYGDVKDRLSMDKTTFYRNIAIFEENSIIKSFESSDKKRYFAIERRLHPHFICTKCNAIVCLSEELLFELDGYQIDSVVIKGICPHCL